MFQPVFRIHCSYEDRCARVRHADVDRALEALGAEVSAEQACISGDVRSLRRRLDDLLDDLLPPAYRPGIGTRLLRWAGFTARARAADAALAALFGECSPQARHLCLRFVSDVQAPSQRSSPDASMRGHIADALDDAYCVMLPHEAARRAELHRAFWASAREDSRKRAFTACCLERLE